MATIDELRTGDTRQNDWDGYGAAATTDAALDAAQRFADWMAPKFPEWLDHFVPTSDGGIYLDLEVQPNHGGRILIEWEPDGGSLADLLIERLRAGNADND